MKNLKVLSFVLLFSVLVVAGCEKANNQEKVSCEGEDVCPVEINVEDSSLEIEKAPDVIVNAYPGESDSQGEFNGDEYVGLNSEGDLNGNLEGDGEIIFENNEQTVEEPSDQPMMRIMVDENVNPGEIEITPSQTCEALGGTWDEGDCTLSDGSKVYF